MERSQWHGDARNRRARNRPSTSQVRAEDQIVSSSKQVRSLLSAATHDFHTERSGRQRPEQFRIQHT
jgi:hypothetical protein